MVIKAELDEIKAGLDTLGVLTLLQSHPVTIRALFIAYQYQLTCDIMQDIFLIIFSIKGSNDREKEEEVALFYLLQDVQSKYFQSIFTFSPLLLSVHFYFTFLYRWH